MRLRHTRALTLAAALLLGTGLLAASDLAHGSTPNAGTLTTTSGPLAWSGGPFTTPNVTGNAGPVDCTVPNSCDDYALTIDTPAGTGDTKIVKIAVSWTNTAADFDAYLLDSAGNVVASSASSSDPETMAVPPTSGAYTVRVVPYLPLGSSYSASAALVDAPNDGAPGSNAPTPSFRNFHVPTSFTDSHNSGEPSIGYNTKTGASFFQSSLSTYKVKFDDSVSPPTASWKNVSASASNGCPQGSTTSLDPILYTDRTTGRTFESQLSGVDSLTCYTDDDGATWHPSQGGGIPSGVDHQTLGGGPFVASDPLNSTNLYPRAVYYCSQDIATAFCALSRDGGLTFGAGVPIYSLLDCDGLHGHIAVAPDGTAYVPNKSCGGKQGVAVSSDDGTTWTVRTAPNSLPGDTDPAVAVGANGTMYFGYANGDGTPHVAVSHDAGQTFATDYNVGSSLGIKNVVFPTAVAGDDNRAAISFLGTTTAGNYQDAANFHGVWYLYTAFTYDGGKTWKTVNDTPNDPVQRGSICTAGTTCGSDRNLLDFIGSTIDSKGRVEVAYADGCTDTCVTGTQNNFDARGAIARQVAGLGLYSAYDKKPNLVISKVSVAVDPTGTSRISATMSNVGKAGAPAAPVRFFVDGRLLGTSTAKAVSAGSSANFAFNWNTRQVRGSHTVTVVADPDNVVAESDESDNRTATTVSVG